MIFPLSHADGCGGNGQESIRLGHGVLDEDGTDLVGYRVACVVARLQCIHPKRPDAASSRRAARANRVGEFGNCHRCCADGLLGKRLAVAHELAEFIEPVHSSETGVPLPMQRERFAGSSRLGQSGFLLARMERREQSEHAVFRKVTAHGIGPTPVATSRRLLRPSTAAMAQEPQAQPANTPRAITVR